MNDEQRGIARCGGQSPAMTNVVPAETSDTIKISFMAG
jgi:hypothetical protein